MKKVLTLTFIAVTITMFSSCLSALHPLFTIKDLVFDPKLVGTWSTGDGDDDITIFERGSASSFKELPATLRQVVDKAYLLTIRKKDGSEEFKYYAFLVRIGNELYFDYYPAENRWQRQYDGFYKQHYIRMHSFYRVRFKNDRSFEISQFDERFLRDLIDQKKIRIRHEVRFDGLYVITAPTEELQQYVMKYGNVPEAYYKDNTTTYSKIQ